MSAVLLLAAAGGSVVAVSALDKKTGPATLKTIPAKVPVSGAASALAMIKSRQGAVSSAAVVKNPVIAGRASTFNDYRPGGSKPSEAEAAVTKAAKAAYSKISAEAKKAAMAALKKANPNSPAIQALPDSGNVDYDAVMKAVAAAAGAAACAATGAGAIVSPLCGIAASWIAGWAGPKFKEWANDAYDGAKDLAGDALDAITFW